MGSAGPLIAWLLADVPDELDGPPERLERFVESEWLEVPVGGSGHFSGAGLVQLARNRRRQAWHMARAVWAEARGLSPADLPQDEAS